MAKRDTKTKILKTGLKMWLENPDSVTANGIASRIGMTHATILYHFPEGVKDAVAEFAVRTKNARIVAQLIVTGHKAAEGLAPSERAEYLSTC